MWTTDVKPHISSFAPLFLVDDLSRSIAFYQTLGFFFDEPNEGLYAIGNRGDMGEVHLKQAPKNKSERVHRRANGHPDASAGVHGIEAFFKQCVDAGVSITTPLAPKASGRLGFQVEDPDGYIISFEGLTSLPRVEIERVRECLRRDVASTLGPGYDDVILNAVYRQAMYNDDLSAYRSLVVNDVQQYFHDAFVDTVWPACPRHPNHPLWLHGEDWCCEQAGEAFAKLGELRK